MDRTAERGATTFLPEPEPGPLWCPIISVDDHVLEPPDLFEGRVPKAFEGRVPTVVTDADDVPYWSIDGALHPITPANGAVGRPVAEWTVAPQKFEEFRRGVWDPVERLADMDLAGLWASLNFPSIMWGFAGRRLTAMRDGEAAWAAFRAYNQWMVEEWCGVAPDRYIPCQLPWLNDPEVAASEVRRNAELGFKAVSFTENPEALGLPGIHGHDWDPFLAACEETGTVINLHVGSSGSTHFPSKDTPVDAKVALFPVSGIVSVVDWIYSRIPLRFPGLRIAMSEAGASWVPMVIERLHRAYRQVDASGSWSLSDPDPAEVLHRNFWFTSIEDPSAFRMLDVIGDGNVMVEADYPHPDSSWPDVQGMVRGQLEHLPVASIRRLCFENAAALYRHPEPPPAWLSRSILLGGQAA